MLHANWFQTLCNVCPLYCLAESCASGVGEVLSQAQEKTQHLYCHNTHVEYTFNTWRLYLKSIYEATVRCLSWRILVTTCMMTHCTCPVDSDFFMWTVCEVWNFAGPLARQAVTQPRNLLVPLPVTVQSCEPSLDDHHKYKTQVGDICGLFHETTSPVMTGENTSQNDNNDWSPFHRMSIDKQLLNCNKATDV